MTEDKSVEDKSVLEVLDFVISPRWTGDENTPNLCGIEQLILEVSRNKYPNNETIHLHEAASFAAFFATPRDIEIRAEFETLTTAGKIAWIRNVLNEKKCTSFTRFS